MTDERILYAEGFEDALIGTGSRCGQLDIAVYDVDKCIQVLIKRDGMTYEDAHEFFEFNVEGAWLGDKTPIWVRPKAETNG